MPPDGWADFFAEKKRESEAKERDIEVSRKRAAEVRAEERKGGAAPPKPKERSNVDASGARRGKCTDPKSNCTGYWRAVFPPGATDAEALRDVCVKCGWLARDHAALG